MEIMQNHPILNLQINEDGTKIIYNGKPIKIHSYSYPRNNYLVHKVNIGVRTFDVPKLVCETYHGMRETPEQVVARKDFDPENNHYTNLYWSDKGRVVSERTKRSKLSKIKKDEIKDVVGRLDAGESCANIAKSYGTSHASIRRIRKRFLEDSKMQLRDRVITARTTHARNTAYAKYMGYSKTSKAIGELGKDGFLKKVDEIAVSL